MNEREIYHVIPEQEPEPLSQSERRLHADEEARRFGFRFDQMAPGESVQVDTEHTTYLLEQKEDGLYISGHPKYCPKPVKVKGILGMSSIPKKQSGLVYVGERLLVDLEDGKSMQTSKVDKFSIF